jgi:hypothetical protein
MNEKLEILLQEKAFEELSGEERQWVLQQVSEAEYRRLRNTIHSLQEHSRETVPAGPSPDLKERLLRQYRAGKRLPLPLWKRPVPLWQAVAGVLAMIIFSQWGPWRSSPEPSSPEVITQIVHDTIYIPSAENANAQLENEKSPARPGTSPPKNRLQANIPENRAGDDTKPSPALPITGIQTVELAMDDRPARPSSPSEERQWLELLVETERW